MNLPLISIITSFLIQNFSWIHICWTYCPQFIFHLHFRNREREREREMERGREGRKGWREDGEPQKHVSPVTGNSEHSCMAIRIPESQVSLCLFLITPISHFGLLLFILKNHGEINQAFFIKMNKLMMFSFLYFSTSSFSFLLQSS